MRHRSRPLLIAVLILMLVAIFSVAPRRRAEAAGFGGRDPGVRVAQEPVPDSEATYGPSFAYLAWNLFLEAMAPAQDHLAFEGWTEQCQLNPEMVGCATGAHGGSAGSNHGPDRVRRLHASVGLRDNRVPGSDCSAMTATPLGGYPAPANLTRNAIYCEEVYVSPAEAAFVRRYLLTLSGQELYGKQRSGAINFPGTEQNESRLDLDSVEVKVDWVPMSSFHPTFACPDATNTLYTETIDGTCYALAAIHISSKVMPNWLWATFEPRSEVTNPNRCDPLLYGPCFDPYGTTSSRPYGKGQEVRQSAELRLAMDQAHLPPAFRNYFLTGVQTQFVDSDGKAIALGNSFVEFNQGVPPGKSSCITCHQYASFDGAQPARGRPENGFGRPPHGWPSLGYACNQGQKGNCLTPDATATAQDFSWMLGLMPFAGADGSARESAPAVPPPATGPLTRNAAGSR